MDCLTDELDGDNLQNTEQDLRYFLNVGMKSHCTQYEKLVIYYETNYS